MKRELGIARCGLACCLCSENVTCNGCNSGECPDKDWCENRECTVSKKIGHCYECNEKCRKGLLAKIKPYAFTEFDMGRAAVASWVLFALVGVVTLIQFKVKKRLVYE